jgi:hypothetical protein
VSFREKKGCLFAMSDFHDQDDQPGVENFINDAVVAEALVLG